MRLIQLVLNQVIFARLFATFAVSAGLFSTSAYAADTPGNFTMTCTTSVAGLALFADGNRFHLHLEDSAGFANFPIYSGVVTPSFLPIVERGLKELAAFDGVVDITWDLAKCKVDPKRPYLVSCSGLGEISKPANVAFVATSMGSSTDKIESLDVEAQTVNVFLGLSTTGTDFMHYFINFPFDSRHCSAK
jgi:hypothetical protein